MSFDSLRKAQEKSESNNIEKTFEAIFKGGMPKIQDQDGEVSDMYFDSYVDSYLMKDVFEIEGIKDWSTFRRFLGACAALTAQQLNFAKLSASVGISQPTAKKWVEVLEGMGIVFLLKPFSNNILKRLTKSQKLYFADTGLCAHLAKWPSAKTLMAGPQSGAYYENFVISEIWKNSSYASHSSDLFYYRDSNGKEIDLIVEDERGLHPFEIKLATNPKRSITRFFDVLNLPDKTLSHGGIICMCERPLPIDERNCYVPSNLI